MKPIIFDNYDDLQCNRMCNSWVAAAVVGTSLVGAGAQIYGANKASSAQQTAAQQAAQLQAQQYAQTRADLAPYRNLGGKYAAELDARMPELTSDIDVTAELRDPNSTAAKAYAFTKTQGLKAVQNSAAARGLGVSGAALKGAANFVTGLADNTYTNLFNMTNTNRTNAYSRLKGLVDLGQSSSAQTSQAGQASTAGQADAITGGANAEAAAWNASGNAVKKAASDVGGYAAYKGLYGNGNGYVQPGYNADNKYA